MNDRADSGMSEELNPGIHTGVGNPLDPYNNELLSVEDEKSLDDKGRRVVMGELWSKAGTDLWLGVALHPQLSGKMLFPSVAQVDLDLSDIVSFTKAQWVLTLSVTQGRTPVYVHDVVGAALELPSDLATDPLKRTYVAEWLNNTVDECFKNRKLRVGTSKYMDLAIAMERAGDLLIQRTGL